MRGQNGVEFDQKSNGHVGFFLALLLAEIANDSEGLRMSQSEGEREGARGLFLGRFYSTKWLAFPVLGHKKDPSDNKEVCHSPRPAVMSRSPG